MSQNFWYTRYVFDMMTIMYSFFLFNKWLRISIKSVQENVLDIIFEFVVHCSRWISVVFIVIRIK
jgi:hypothetical protein